MRNRVRAMEKELESYENKTAQSVGVFKYLLTSLLCYLALSLLSIEKFSNATRKRIMKPGNNFLNG